MEAESAIHSIVAERAVVAEPEEVMERAEVEFYINRGFQFNRQLLQPEKEE